MNIEVAVPSDWAAGQALTVWQLPRQAPATARESQAQLDPPARDARLRARAAQRAGAG